MSGRGYSRIQFLNTYVDNVTVSDVRFIISEHLVESNPGYMVSLNSDMCVRMERDQEFSQAFNSADLILMDSQPLYMYAKSRGIPIKEKISGSDLMDPVCRWAEENGWTCFFLGGKEGVPEAAVSRILKRYPKMQVAGTLSPQIGFETDEAMTREVILAVRRSSPDILFFCCGAPKSEKFISAHLDEMGVPFTLSVGAAIDFMAGTARRAPKWMQGAGLEWFYRFLQEPGRLFKRYFVDCWRLIPILKKYR